MAALTVMAAAPPGTKSLLTSTTGRGVVIFRAGRKRKSLAKELFCPFSICMSSLFT